MELQPDMEYDIRMKLSDRQTIFIGVGEVCDPLAGKEKPSRYLITCSPCPGCSSPSRIILPHHGYLLVSCDDCSFQEELALSSSVWADVAYYYWCRSSKFESDEVEISPAQRVELEKFLAGYNEQEKPAWGVLILAGLCQKRGVCIRNTCPYHGSVERFPKEYSSVIIPFPGGNKP